jgi:hypothetical protein
MQCCLIGLLPGFSGRNPEETRKDLRAENRSLTTWGDGSSGSSGFPGSSGEITECSSRSFYYLWLGILRRAARVKIPIHLTISRLTIRRNRNNRNNPGHREDAAP